MKSNYKRLGDYIRPVDERNIEDKRFELLGVSVEKRFIKSIANTVGTDWRGYKIIRRGQFCYISDTSRRGDKIGIALQNACEIALVSQAYTVFEITKLNKMNPAYLELWFKRTEFDRYARYHSHGSVREIFDWDALCDVMLPIPSLAEQQKIVDAYNVIENRIALKRKINENLEAQMLVIFDDFISVSDKSQKRIYDILIVTNGAAFSSEFFNANGIGLPLIRIRDLKTSCPEIFSDEILSNAVHINTGDIVIGMDGEFLPYIWVGETGLLNQRVCKVSPAATYVHPFFLFATLKPILNEIERTQGGTTVIHLGKKDFDKMTCVNLTKVKHEEFYKLVAPIYKKWIAYSKETLSLARLKKLLLTNLSR